jgi:hypothetical protein
MTEHDRLFISMPVSVRIDPFASKIGGFDGEQALRS